MKKIIFFSLIILVPFSYAVEEVTHEDLVSNYEKNEQERNEHSSWTHLLSLRHIFSSGEKESNISYRWKQYKAANKVQDRIKQIQNTPVDKMDSNFIAQLQKSYEVQALTPKQIKGLSEQKITNPLFYGEYKINLFQPAQIKLFNKKQIDALNFDNLGKEFNNGLTDEQKSWITIKKIENLTLDNFQKLKKDQIKKYNIQELKALKDRSLELNQQNPQKSTQINNILDQASDQQKFNFYNEYNESL